MAKIIVIGGGAAGMIAAIAAAENGNNEVTIIEKNEKLGKKVYITGKGRCNITNVCDREDFFGNIVHGSRFMYSSFDMFSNWDIYASLEEWGLPLKIERGQRVFPDSDKSSDVIRTLQRKLQSLNCNILYNTAVTDLILEDGICAGVKTAERRLYADAVIVATGGLSYPSTGSTGDGYRFAKETGHRVTALTPSLVGFKCSETFCSDLSGLSLKNISISIKDDEIEKGKKGIYSEFGELLFTHKGISGPLVLTASAYLARAKKWPKELFIDLKPAIEYTELDTRICKLLEDNNNKSLKAAVSSILPAKLLNTVLMQSGINAERKACEISKKDRQLFVSTLKGLKLTVEGLCGYNEAVITSGGVDVTQINPKTMESKLVKGLYIVGELLDVDALTGGFNLQIAWSTGYAAGKSIGE